MFIWIGGNTTGSLVTIQNSTFTRNRAIRGAGVYAFYEQDALNNKIAIINSNFTLNEAKLSGGGVNIGFNNPPSAKNVFVISNCIYNNNIALYGAGLTIYSVYDSKSVSNSVVITGSSWYNNNTGEVSPAVDIAPIYGHVSQGYLPIPVFVSYNFYNNTIHNIHNDNKMTHRVNTGVFAVTKFKVLIGGHTSFKLNRFSAIVLTGGVIEFQNHSVISFVKNLGYNGGAVAMYGFSTILFNPFSFTEFRSNQAINNGGAIYYHTNDQHSFFHAADVQCFLCTTVWGEKGQDLISSIEVVFNENVAAKLGSAIYSESFEDCHRSCAGEDTDSDVYTTDDIFTCIGNFTFRSSNGTKSSQLESSGMRFKEAHSSCREVPADKICTMYNEVDDTTAVSERKSIKAHFHCKSIPGDEICLPFYVLDEFNHTVRPVLAINKPCRNDQVDVTDPYSLTNRIHTAGIPNSSSDFIVSVLGVRQIYFSFRLSLLPCPPATTSSRVQIHAHVQLEKEAIKLYLNVTMPSSVPN